MKNSHEEEALRTIKETMGDRLRSRPREDSSPDGALASALPVSAEEVEFLATVAERCSIPLVALGGGTTPGLQPAVEGSILIRFDLMRGLRLPDADEPWAEAEPGALWLQLDNNLRVRGRGLAVYPTSAPRATVGGWIAQDGLGVGSFEYGWLGENVLSADVVLPGGERRVLRDDELKTAVNAGGVIVGARLRTRRAERDQLFGLSFSEPEALAAAIEELLRADAPLWHVAFLNRELARFRGLGEDHLLFGAYPAERAAKAEEALREAAKLGGREMPPAEAYRTWGERFFPVAPAHPMPARAERVLSTVADVAEALGRNAALAVQGTVAASGEVLLLTFDAREPAG